MIVPMKKVSLIIMGDTIDPTACDLLEVLRNLLEG